MLRDPEPLYPKTMEMPHLTMPVSEHDHIQGPVTAAVTFPARCARRTDGTNH